MVPVINPRHSFGFQSHKRANLFFMDDNTLLTSIGNALVFINLKTNEHTYVQGPREGSIGAVAVRNE